MSSVILPGDSGYRLGWRPDLEKPARQAWAESGSPPRFTSTIFGADSAPQYDAFTTANLIYFWFNQAQLGSCAFNSTTQAVQIGEAGAARQLGQPIDDRVMFSRRFAWYNGRTLDGSLGSGDTGGSVTNALRAFHEFGAAPDSIWPYNPQGGASRLAWCEKKPSADVFAAAKLFGLSALLDLDFADADGIERSIASYLPPVMGIWWPYGWDQGQIDRYGRTSGIGNGVFGHALAIIGYVRPKIWDRYRWWHICNSHGPIYPLPSQAMRDVVVGYASARANSCYTFWVRDDHLQTVVKYGNAELVAPVGPYAPDPRSLSWSSAA